METHLLVRAKIQTEWLPTFVTTNRVETENGLVVVPEILLIVY